MTITLRRNAPARARADHRSCSRLRRHGGHARLGLRDDVRHRPPTSSCEDNVVAATNATAITHPGQRRGQRLSLRDHRAAQSRVIGDLDVTLFDVSHTWPDDIDVLLVGPGGQQVTLISDAGGGVDAGEDFVVDDLTFDDSAATLVPDETAPNLNTYRPTNYGARRHLPGAGAHQHQQHFARRTSTTRNAAGTWQLCVVDDEAPDNGEIAGGWELDFTLLTDPYPAPIAVTGLPRGQRRQRRRSAGLIQLCAAGRPRPVARRSRRPAVHIIERRRGQHRPSNVSITFDDEAAGPALTAIRPSTAASYQPFNHGDFLDFPAPAPRRRAAPRCRCSTAPDPTAVAALVTGRQQRRPTDAPSAAGRWTSLGR